MEILIDENSANQRLDRFLRKYCKPYPDVKLSDIFLWLRKGAVQVYNTSGKGKKKESYRLQLGDVVVFRDDVKLGEKNPFLMLSQKDQKIQGVDQKKLQKMILFEDEHRVVFDKLAGIVMHGGNKHSNDLSMNDYLAAVVRSRHAEFPESRTSCGGSGSLEEGEILKQVQNDGIGGYSTFKPSFGYRLDKDTSGVLIAAKTYDALQYLNQIIRERIIDKNYLCLVAGEAPLQGDIELNLEKIYDKEFGKSRVVAKKNGEWTAKTSFVTKKTIAHPDLGKISLLEVKIYTGRMHQIRVHLAELGYPVLGDLMYGNPAINRKLYKLLKINRQLLHCSRYSFWDPYVKQHVEFVSRMPEDFARVIDKR